MDEDATRRSRLTSFSPVFPVRDLRRALTHYASLGFDTAPYADGDYYGFASRDDVNLHLSAEGHDHKPDDDAEPGRDHGHQHGGAAVIQARPMVFIAWAVLTGRTTPAQALAGVAELRVQAQGIADRAREALAR